MSYHARSGRGANRRERLFRYRAGLTQGESDCNERRPGSATGALRRGNNLVCYRSRGGPGRNLPCRSNQIVCARATCDDSCLKLTYQCYHDCSSSCKHLGCLIGVLYTKGARLGHSSRNMPSSYTITHVHRWLEIPVNISSTSAYMLCFVLLLLSTGIMLHFTGSC